MSDRRVPVLPALLKSLGLNRADRRALMRPRNRSVLAGVVPFLSLLSVLALFRVRHVTVEQYAEHRGCHHRTIRNYIGAGYFPVYRRPGQRGVLIDLDEADAALSKIPSTKARPAFGSFGPNAQIVVLPPLAEITDARLDTNEDDR